MKLYNISYKITNEKNKMLSQLAARFKEMNGWDEQEMLQFAFDQFYEKDIEKRIEYLEGYLDKLEYEKETGLEDCEYCVELIQDEEREKCQKVINAYKEDFEKMEILVLDGGKYGFYKLLFSSFPVEVQDAIVYVRAKELFNALWEEWLESELLILFKDSHLLELDYDEMYECLPEKKQKEIMAKREYFAKKAELA
ncbi:MAG: hypothetical protein K2P44_13535 [Lachnospiraceae bacterium]|nr:hypothetical protein [Lachnospiraceae bacterium]